MVKDSGYIREGYFADLVMVDLNGSTTVNNQNMFYKCGWSPLEGETLGAKISKTFVNGVLVYDEGMWNEQIKGKRLLFDR